MDAVQNSGFCHCCRQEAVFEIQGNWLRDDYVCLNCGSIPRQRHVQLILDTHFPGWEQKTIHESSPSNCYISQFCQNYSQSQFFQDIDLGGFNDGMRCENLEQLTFSRDSFDLFITQDVFEHIFDPRLAALEIMRVLKPGGAHIFTVPKHRSIVNSYPRANIVEGKVEHLFEEQYHGNPIGDGRALVTWDYGQDFEVLFGNWAAAPVSIYVTRDRGLGIDAEFNEVFVVRKT